MKKVFFIIFIFFSHYSHGQNPLVKMWDSRFGGDSIELLGSLIPTKDGGVLLAGSSRSGTNGDKSQASHGSNDFWIVKVNPSGNKEWDRDFGGTGSDGISSVANTTDNGFILGGSSSSGISGDKTQVTQTNLRHHGA